MKILIIDNEQSVRETLKEMVLRWPAVKAAVVEADGVETGLQAIAQFQPNIVLLDVEMNDGNGFDLLKKLGWFEFQLIFTTAHNQYALPAIKYSALDYLLKPVDPVELYQSLQKAQHKIEQSVLQQQLQVLMKQFNQQADQAKQIVLKDIDKTYFINVEDILYCEAEGSYTKFYISNSEPIFVSKNLRSYEEMLAPSGFIRTHHSCLVNPRKIKIYDRKTDCGTLILEGGYTIPVSQRKREFVLQYLERKGE
ncbi:MAG: LytTR family DNA-binding domain-containing protein [Chitinophagaceae bacterium]|uniref:LytR/AlgR family response regulator transcription factor n=1 Tax=unclassified Paraflavitalea TaxID=2798305 RepID=UPI003D345110|nr:LytTR family DNA-binding domain-containing protein [Chitinophagaceae bacterium]